MRLNEDLPELQQNIELFDAIQQAPDKSSRKRAIAQAAEALGKSTRNI